MAWFGGKVNLGNFPDLAGAVNKIQESVKNIEKNFDTALGFEGKQESSTNEASGLWPVVSFMGQKGEEAAVSSSEQSESQQQVQAVEDKEDEIGTRESGESVMEKAECGEEENEDDTREVESEPSEKAEAPDAVSPESSKAEAESKALVSEPIVEKVETSGSIEKDEDKASEEVESTEEFQLVETQSEKLEVNNEEGGALAHDESPKVAEVHDESLKVVDAHDGSPEAVDVHDELPNVFAVDEASPKVVDVHDRSPKVIDVVDGSPKVFEVHESTDEQTTHAEEVVESSSMSSSTPVDASDSQAVEGIDDSISHSDTMEEAERIDDLSKEHNSLGVPRSDTGSETVSEVEAVSSENDTIAKVVDTNQLAVDTDTNNKVQHLSSVSSMPDPTGSSIELEKVKKDMKMMEAALQGAARQAQAKADEIARLMTENEQLKSMIDDLKGQSNEAEVESLREEYHQRVATLERKVYALTRERDTLRREQNRKSDAAALLKEKDEIITQVMAEGEELSKKQAAQEGQIRKLRAQVRELDEEKKGLITKLQVEENKVESIKKDKGATEKLLQETIEKHQAELAAQKEFYTNALNSAKEAEALAEARANSEARTELESRLREAEEREGMLVQALEELRQTLSRQEQQAAFREDMLRRDIEDLQKRYQASERRCEELVTQVPESTRPLLRQIEAMQETTSRRAEAWAAVERSLSSRLQEAEAKAAGAEERERSINERLSQTLSRINVLEAQISCLRAEQTQLSRSLEKERQRAAENRQEYLVAKEEADTQEGRASQLEEELRELKRKHKQELQEALMQREHLEQEMEREKAARLELERTARVQSAAVSDQTSISRHNSAFENGHLTRRLSSASSLGSMEESYFLQASLDSSDTISERRNPGEPTMSPYYMKSMTPSAFESALRQKEGELASYMSRLGTMESIRDSLAEELVKMTEQCEKLRAEAALLPGVRAELESLRRRHSAALELMGERDEELEELRADIVDLKEMYREQVNLLVNKIQTMNS